MVLPPQPQSEEAGWDAVVKAGLAASDVVRSSDTVVTITVLAASGYSVVAAETITVSVPSTAVTSANGITGSPTVVIMGDAGTLTVSGSIASSAVEGTLKDSGYEMALTHSMCCALADLFVASTTSCASSASSTSSTSCA